MNDRTDTPTPADTPTPTGTHTSTEPARTGPGSASTQRNTSGPDPARTVPAGQLSGRRRAGRRATRSGHPRPSGWLAGHRPHRPHRPHERPGRLRRTAATVTAAGLAVAVSAGPAAAAPPASLNDVINRVTAWLVGIAAGLATLFLTYGAVRYLSAGGDPGSVEKAKTALRSAAIGYGLAVLAPLVVTVLNTFVS